MTTRGYRKSSVGPSIPSISFADVDFLATFMGDRARANVATSRQQEALYFVGQANFWFQNMAWKKRSLVMHDILRFMQNKATELSRPDFVVRAQGWTPRYIETLQFEGDNQLIIG